MKDPKLSVSSRRRPKITIISFETNPFINLCSLNRTSLFPILTLFFVFILKLRHDTLVLKARYVTNVVLLIFKLKERFHH